MNILYIDANIYLGFYNSNRPEFKKLLNSIVELSDKIFFTIQFADEIDRNKLTILSLSLENYIKQGVLTKTILPEHLDDDEYRQITKWNLKRKKLDIEISKSNNELLAMFNVLLQSVSLSKDNVSNSLIKLYERAYHPTANDLNNARIRKELGNPPGKINDPLGDQLSWEMLLNIIPDVKNIWIISRDRDYFTEHNGKLYLNPVLSKNLLSINPQITIKVFNKLSDALKDFGKHEEVITIPSNEQLEEISIDESYFDYKSANSEKFIDDFDIIILKLLSEGYSIVDISEFFNERGEYITSATIDMKISKLKVYLDASNRVHLISVAKNIGLI